MSYISRFAYVSENTRFANFDHFFGFIRSDRGHTVSGRVKHEGLGYVMISSYDWIAPQRFLVRSCCKFLFPTPIIPLRLQLMDIDGG